jgi:hypothetical protein
MEELEKIVDKLELENSKRAASDPLTKTALRIVEEFLKTHPVMCYGGTAINNLLPKKDQFYDPEIDVPDYDFFSRTPQEHAMIISNKLSEAGIKNVEVKPGIHLGTFKVFSDFEGVADITELEEELFEKLWKEDIVKDGIHYVPPNFLRMSMYLELSRPRGDVSRWKKVYARLLLLNKHYPITCKDDKSVKHSTVTPQMKAEIKRILTTHDDVVLLGVTAAEVHMQTAWTTPVMLMAPKETIEKLTKGKKVIKDEGTEILPPRYAVEEEDGSSHIRYYESTACHSYHNAPGGIKVASIPTILQFFFAYIYSRVSAGNIESMLCIAQRLMDMANSKPKRRFDILTPTDCFGTQKTLIDMRKEKAELYEKYGTDKTSADFLRYFFTYSPKLDVTQRKKLRDQLRKTRKARSGKTE